MSTSWPNSLRNAKASRTALMHAWTWSALTWMIGTSKPFARSEAQRVERASSGSVVKPTWLFMMMCTVPPTLYPSRACRLSVSETTPWPGNEASPWITIGTAASVSWKGMRAVAGGLRGARGALDDRRDELEVAGVGLEVDADGAAAGQLVGALRAVVVLDVP